MNSRLQTFEANGLGRDFVVGDIHGCFYMLEALLARIGFDRSHDRLFSVGDLIDRGPDSERAVEFLSAPWFHAIRGNHEQMLLDAVTLSSFNMRRAGARRLWEANGGGWFAQLPKSAQHDFAERIAMLPYAFEVALPRQRSAAIVHADVLDDSWRATREVLLRTDRRDDRWLSTLIWKRTRAHALQHQIAGAMGPRVAVDGIDLVAFGHTPAAAPIACANTRWLDSGAVMGNRLSVAELAIHGEVWSLAADLEDCRTGWQHV